MLERSNLVVGPAPPARSTILRPSMRTLPAGVERYRIAGGESVIVDLEAGDAITVSDVEGGQPCELVVFGADGRGDAGVLGAGTGAVSPPWSLAHASSSFRERLTKRGVTLDGASAIRLFGPASLPGTTQDFRAERRGILIASAPAGMMEPGGQA